MSDLRAPDHPRHLVVVVGAAVAGAEAAALCAERGASVVVLERNSRPFGKIEDGLPRWHRKLREQEYARIVQRLSHPNIHFVPETALGRDVSIQELLDDWQVSGVLLASGAWRDRPLPVEGADAFVDRGLLYQNPLVHWYNHYPEPDYPGPHYEVPNGPIVVGGGLAAIDVSKILNLQLYKRALASRGHAITTEELEHHGIPEALAERGLTPASLGVTDTTLCYRRSKREMPLVAMPEGASDVQRDKVASVRERLMDKVTERFLVRFAGHLAPVEAMQAQGRLTGLRFQRTHTVAGKLQPVEGELVDMPSGLVVSSIGSIPEPVPGLPMKGELIDFADWHTGRVRGLERVFALGNALTGKGNIKDSRRNAAEIAEYVLSQYLGLAAGAPDASGAHDAARDRAEPAVSAITNGLPCSPAALARAFAAVSTHWKRTGYDGELAAWIERSMPSLSE